MFRTLRSRLIFSHIFPLLLVVPILAAALIYILESQVLLGSISTELIAQAEMVSNLSNDEPEIWQGNLAEAQNFTTHVADGLAARVMLFDLTGRLLASSDMRDASMIGQIQELSQLTDVIDNNERSVTSNYSPQLSANVADVFVPVNNLDGDVIGVARLTLRLQDVYNRFQDLRSLVGMVLLGALTISALIGWVLAINLQRPLRNVTQAVHELAEDQRPQPLPRGGVEELDMLTGAFNTLLHRLEVSEQARQQLLANVVHELGRPLGAMSSAVQALNRGASEDETLRVELLTGMEEGVRRLRRLLDDLTQYYGRGDASIKLNREPTDPAHWLMPLLAPWRTAAESKGLHWKTDVAPDLPQIFVDPDRLAQALGNLVSNAIKYTPSGGFVRVNAGQENDQVFIVVSDSGIGIAPSEQPNIFEPFYRGSSTGRFPQGMGLGLTIARDIVLAHGGGLHAQSSLDVGSVFTMWIPIWNDDEKS